LNFYFIASPYTSHDKDPDKAANERDSRYWQAMRFAAWCNKTRGLVVFSPIVHCHPMAKHYRLGLDSGYWKVFGEGLMRGAGAIIVLCIPGWRESKGVQGEIDFDKARNFEIQYATPWPSPEMADTYKIERDPPDDQAR